MGSSSSNIGIIPTRAFRFPLVVFTRANRQSRRRSGRYERRPAFSWSPNRRSSERTNISTALDGTARSHFFRVDAPDGLPQAWRHVVSGEGEDAGHVFECRFDESPSPWPVQSVFWLPGVSRATQGLSETDSRLRAVRLIVARCEVAYSGRLNAFLPESTRLLMLKEDGSVLVHADAGGFKPLNWMTPPTVIEHTATARRRAQARRAGARIASRSALEVLSDVDARHGRGGRAREGRRRARPAARCSPTHPTQIDPALRLVKREWPTDVGPVDLMCRDAEDGWVAVEIKRVGTIDAVEQLTRYLDCIRVDPSRAACRGILAAQQIKPQAVDTRRVARHRAASRSTSRCCAASASPS